MNKDNDFKILDAVSNFLYMCCEYYLVVEGVLLGLLKNMLASLHGQYQSVLWLAAAGL